MINLYKRNAQGKPLIWSASSYNSTVIVEYGLVGGKLHKEVIPITLTNANELKSRVKAKRKEGYKEINDLKDGVSQEDLIKLANLGVKLDDGKIHISLLKSLVLC